MIRSLFNTLTQAVQAAWTWVKEHIFPFLISPMTKSEYALLRRTSTIFQMSIAMCLIVATGMAEMTSVLVLFGVLVIGLYFLHHCLQGEVGEIAGLAK